MGGYQHEITNYDKGPDALRDLGITHINSPIHSLLHLLSREEKKYNYTIIIL